LALPGNDAKTIKKTQQKLNLRTPPFPVPPEITQKQKTQTSKQLNKRFGLQLWGTAKSIMVTVDAFDIVDTVDRIAIVSILSTVL